MLNLSTCNNVKQAPVKKIRKGGPHSKNGCATCRLRHVKCDETWPACFRCASTGRKCDGYRNKPPSSGRESPASGLWTGSVISLLPQADRNDFRYIQFFHLRGAPALTGYYDSTFWSELLLQASFTDAAVRHALVAVSCTFETQEKALSQGQSLGRSVKTQSNDRDFVLRQYNHAIRSLTQRSPGNKPSREIVLITCLLFICLEFLHGNVDSALMHLANGLHVLHEDFSSSASSDPEAFPHLQPPSLSPSISQQSRSTETEVNAMNVPETSLSRSVSSGPNSDEVKKMIRPLYSRLSCLASFFGQPMFDRIASDHELRMLSIPTVFSSITEAHTKLTVVLTRIFAFYRECAPCRYAASSARRWPPESVKRLLEARLAEWSCSFAVFLSANLDSLSPSSLSTVSFLKLLRHVLVVFLGICFSSYELAYDAHLSDFKAIVSHAETLVDKESISPSFSFEMGIVPPLYWTAIKCRHHAVRWRAIELMRLSQRREGLWDSDLDARAATRVIGTEEQGVQFEDIGDEEEQASAARMSVLVPEPKRVYDTAIEKQPVAPPGKHRIQISTRPAGPGTPFVTQDEFV